MTRMVRSLVVLLSLLTATDSVACTCGGSPLKQSFKAAGEFVVADAIRAEPIGNELQMATYSFQRTTFAVVESFKIRQAPGRSLIVEANSDGAACGFKFTVGHRYILQLYQEPELWSPGVWTTGLCTLTQDVNSPGAAGNIETLRRRAWWWRLPISGRR